jgi:hypothetical protein
VLGRTAIPIRKIENLLSPASRFGIGRLECGDLTLNGEGECRYKRMGENDEAILLESVAAPVRDDPGGEHHLWLAMQAAHKAYKQASATLDALTAMTPRNAHSVERDLQIEVAAAEQRTGFENYIEARLQLSEFLVSKRMPVDPAVSQALDQAPVPGPAPRLVVLAVGAAFLLPTAFGVGFLAHERKRTRELNAEHNQITAALNQTTALAQDLTRRVEALKAANQTAARKAAASILAARTDRARAVRKAPVKAQSAAAKVARSHQDLVQLQKRGDRIYREFTLTPEKHSERVGPIALSVENVDPQHKSFDLSITVDSRTLSKKRVNLYEPVWVDVSGSPKAVEVVVNQINWESLQGYLSEPKYPRTTWQRLFSATGLLASR